MSTIVTGIFGAIALGALILGLVWWLRRLDQPRPGGRTESQDARTEGIAAAFRRK